MPARLSSRMRTVAPHGDDGLTVMELVIAMALSTVIGAMTLSLFLNINSTAANSTDRAINTASARNVVQAWAGYLRVADGTVAGSRTNRIEWLTSNDMLFYADLNNRSLTNVASTTAPTMVWLRLDSGGQLVEEQFASTATSGTSPRTCRVLLSRVADATDMNGATVPLFAAADYRNAPMTGQNLGTAPTGVASGCQKLPVTVPSQTRSPDPVAQANLQNVYSVTLDFTVRDSKGLHPLEFTSQAVLPSLGAVG
jgi:Tfp pilus assembly protein PilW